jgi:hypothetical protein
MFLVGTSRVEPLKLGSRLDCFDEAGQSAIPPKVGAAQRSPPGAPLARDVIGDDVVTCVGTGEDARALRGTPTNHPDDPTVRINDWAAAHALRAEDLQDDLLSADPESNTSIRVREALGPDRRSHRDEADTS